MTDTGLSEKLENLMELYGDEIKVGRDMIKIGRSKKKAFLEQLNMYLGG